MKRRDFLVLTATSALALPTSYGASAKPTPWLVPPTVFPPLPTEETAAARPPKGQVITCANGHDFAVVVSGTGGGDFSDWPVLEALQPGTGSLIGQLTPICCSICGAVAIDFAERRGEHTKWV